MSEDMKKKKKTQKVSSATLSKVKRLMRGLRAKSFDDAVSKISDAYVENSNDQRLKKYAFTQHLELLDRYPCIFRYPKKKDELLNGHKRCGRTSVNRDILSIEQCATCQKRVASEESFRRRLEIEEKRPLVISQELGIRHMTASRRHIQLQIEGNHYFWTCEPQQRYSDKGIFEVRCTQCPNDRVKDQWHPVEVCREIACPFLKPLEQVTQKPRKKGEYHYYHH